MLLVFVLASAGCGGSSGTTTSSPPRPAIEQVYDQIGKDGKVSKDTALQAFALTFGTSIPGVTVPKGSHQDIYVGGGAIRWMVQHWSDLGAEQKDAVTKALGFDPTQAPKTAADRPTGASPRYVRVSAESDARNAVAAQIEGARQFIQAHLGRPIPKPVTIVIEQRQPPDNAVIGAAMVQGDDQSCAMHIYPNLTRHLDDVSLTKGLIAHELFHCFQRGLATTPLLSAPWVIEGQAAWVGASYGAQPSYSDLWWHSFLTEPGRPVLINAYSAIGFYAHLAETGVDPWKVFDAMLKVGDKPDAALVASQATASTFADSYASASVRDPGLGTAWDTTGPGVTGDKAPRHASSVSSNSGFSDLIEQTVRHVEEIDVQAETFVLDVSDGAPQGRVRLADNKDRTVTSFNHHVFCTAQQCGCPQDSPLAGTTFEKVPVGKALLALSPVVGPASLNVVGQTLSDACDPTKTAPPDRFTGGTGESKPKGRQVTKVPADICTFLTPSEVSAVVGETVQPSRFGPSGGIGGPECAWVNEATPGQTNEGDVRAQVDAGPCARLLSALDDAHVEGVVVPAQRTAVTGYGDEAWDVLQPRSGQRNFVFCTGGYGFEAIASPGIQPGEPYAAYVQRYTPYLKALAKLILQKIPPKSETCTLAVKVYPFLASILGSRDRGELACKAA